MPYILHYNDVIPEKLLDNVSEKIRVEYLKGQRLTKQTFGLLIKVRRFYYSSSSQEFKQKYRTCMLIRGDPNFAKLFIVRSKNLLVQITSNRK